MNGDDIRNARFTWGIADDEWRDVKSCSSQQLLDADFRDGLDGFSPNVQTIIVADIVTGKLDARAAGAGLPDLADEELPEPVDDDLQADVADADPLFGSEAAE